MFTSDVKAVLAEECRREQEPPELILGELVIKDKNPIQKNMERFGLAAAFRRQTRKLSRRTKPCRICQKRFVIPLTNPKKKTCSLACARKFGAYNKKINKATGKEQTRIKENAFS